MEALALYLIKSTVWLTGFAMVYLLFLRNERFFLLNRIYLVLGIIVSIVFPLFTWHYTVLLANTPTIEVSELQMMGTVDIPEPFPTQAILLYIYLAGALYLLFRVTRQTINVLRVIRKSEILPLSSAKLIRTTEYPASFSFFSFVFVNPSTCDTETNEIVNHEMEHIRQQHWIDLLLFEVLLTLQWFNPLSWLYGHFIRQNHEYLADEQALQRSSNPGIYRAALLNQMFGGPVISLANSFNYSLNKKRFNMMKQTINSPIRKLKLLFILPLIAGVFYAFAAPEYKYNEGTENQDPNKAAYSIAKDKIDISFTPQLEKSDLETIKADLAKLGMKIDYSSLTFTENGKLKQISASIKFPDGTGNSFASGELTPSNYPSFKMESDGSFGVYIKRSITGKVISEDGKPLKGANIVVSGNTIGTVTDENGDFKLELTDDSPIVISYVGFGSQKVKPEFGKEMVITMKPEIVEIDEVKATSYSEPLKLLKGIPMIFGNYDGSGAQPLIVKDGFVIGNQDANNINPENIESINVLKGESATILYGDKGKNGVVLITTKKNGYSIINEPIDVKVNGTDNAQKEITQNKNATYMAVQVMPRFPGGPDALITYINENVKYPAIALRNGIEGKVYVNFMVTKDGSISYPKVIKAVDPLLDQEAIRVIESMPNWKPANQNGENVDFACTVPIDFKLEPSKLSTEKLKDANKQSNQPYTIVEQMPEYPGGAEALRAFIATNIKYPVIALEKGIQGKVFINFVVTKTGSVTNAKVLRGVDPSIDKEAIRVVESLPNWIPGKQNGENVDVTYTIPINFALEPNKISTEKLKGIGNQSDQLFTEVEKILTEQNAALSAKQNQPYTVVEQMPEFPGGEEALKIYIADNLKYPVIAIENGIYGQVYVQFVIDNEGNVTHVNINRGVDPSLDNEAMRIVNSMPKWIPGKQNGKIVNVIYNLPINFKLTSVYHHIADEKLRTKYAPATKQAIVNPNSDQATQNHELIIVPNPTSDKAMITLKGSDSKNKLDVSVYDSYGKMISKESKNGPSFTLSVAKLTTGTYLVVAKDGTTQFQGHLVVNH